MTTYTYARVSTKKQGSQKFGLDRQVIEFKNAGYSIDNLVTDEISGSKMHRKGLDKLKKELVSGDTVVVVSLDRLGRSMVECVNLINDFREMGVAIVSLKESIDTSKDDAFTNFFIQMMLSFSELEKNLMLERQAAAYEAMREQGIELKGRPRKDKQTNEAVKMYLAGGKSYREVAELFGISAATVCNAVKKYREEHEKDS